MLIIEDGKITHCGAPEQLKAKLKDKDLAANNDEGRATSKQGRDSRAKEEKVAVGVGTYCNYFFNNKINWLLVPLALVLFLGTEVLSTFYMKQVALYDQVKEGNRFETTG